MIYRLIDPVELAAAIEAHAADLMRDDFDATQWFSDPNHIVLTDGHNFGLFEAQEEPGVFVGHTVFSSRGREAIEVGRAMVRALGLYGARTIKGQTPVDRRAARWFTRQLGFRSDGFESTPYGDVENFVMECVP